MVNGMTYKQYYSDKSIPKQHNFGLGSPKAFAGGLRTCTNNFYNRLKKIHKATKSIDYKTWINIILLTNKKIAQEILTSELGFKLPYGLGLLKVVGNKQSENKKMYIFKNGKRYIAHNFHSFGYIYGLKWIKGNKFNSALIDVYDFDPTKEVKSNIAVHVKNNFQYAKAD